MNQAPSETLLKHLARVYAFAQLVTPDPAAATRLVRATYQRALDEGALLPEGDALRLYLYRLLLDVRREERGELPTLVPDSLRPHEAPDDLASSRERHAARLVDLHLPPALVSLDTSDRLLLLLCDVEGLPCDEAAQVLEMAVADACAHYEAARATLRTRVLGAVSEHERQMLDEALTPERLRSGIAVALQDELAPLPPTLRPQIAPPAPLSEPGPDLSPPDPFQRWIRTGYLALLVFALAIAAYLLLQRTPTEEESNLIVLAAQQASEASVTLETSDVAQAEAFVENHAGWQLSLPRIEGARLEGAGLAEVATGVSLPVFRYTGADSTRIVLYALNYSLLDQAGGRIALEPDVLEQLEDDTHFELHDIDGTQVLLWRKRDDLFLAVTPGIDRTLARRIRP